MENQPRNIERIAQPGINKADRVGVQAYDQRFELYIVQKEQARRAETARKENERRTRTGLFAAALMAETVISLATNTETNPGVRQRRRQQLNAIWRGFSTQLVDRASRRGVFGL